jgi:hypothetical protein
MGMLNKVLRSVLQTWDDFKQLFRAKPAVAKVEAKPEPPAESKP